MSALEDELAVLEENDRLVGTLVEGREPVQTAVTFALHRPESHVLIQLGRDEEGGYVELRGFDVNGAPAPMNHRFSGDGAVTLRVEVDKRPTT